MLTTEEIKIIRQALLCHAGDSLMPEWDREKRQALTDALDKLRLELLDRIAGPFESREEFYLTINK